MRTSISLHDDLFHAAERAAESLGISRNELYAKALGEYMDRHAESQITERLDEIYGEIDSSDDRPLLDLQLRVLPREDWS